jgi:hyperosmotically inducible periplasmic protein
MKMNMTALIRTSLLAVFFVAAGCTQTNKKSEVDQVKQALQQADLKDVTVSDDTDKNTVTLGGTLHSDDAKNRAGEIAKQAAPDRTIANEISVQPVGDESQARGVASNLDDGIENNYKAALISKRLDKQSIHYKAKNGVLTLTGSVKAPQQKSQAEMLASKVPNVEQVVNQIEVKR